MSQVEDDEFLQTWAHSLPCFHNLRVPEAAGPSTSSALIPHQALPPKHASPDRPSPLALRMTPQQRDSTQPEPRRILDFFWEDLNGFMSREIAEQRLVLIDGVGNSSNLKATWTFVYGARTASRASGAKDSLEQKYLFRRGFLEDSPDCLKTNLNMRAALYAAIAALKFPAAFSDPTLGVTLGTVHLFSVQATSTSRITPNTFRPG